MSKWEKLETTESRYQELENLLADPNVIADQSRYQKFAKEYSDLGQIVTLYRRYKDTEKQIHDLKKFLKEDPESELIELAKKEIEDFEAEKQSCWDKLEELTNPKRHHKNRNLIFEIRAGTGGQEASLFAADLYRMYSRYAETRGWKVEPISSHESETGGVKEVVFSISGDGAERSLKWESGIHRVQRVPVTETSGRIHTSAATVAVLFEPEEVDLQIDQKDLKIDVFRSSGPGGQSVNTTDSAIRITHLPTGLVVICQDERSQLKNKYKAMRVLRARLLDKMEQDNLEKTSEDRKLKVGSGDRSEKIRTYNFPDRRVTDHRIGFTSYKLPNIMDGDLDELVDALFKADQEESIED
jgi:peptide chain release factor 1